MAEAMQELRRSTNGLTDADPAELELLFQALPPHLNRAVKRLDHQGLLLEVVLDLAPSSAAQRLNATLAELVETDDGTLLHMRVSSLDWMAGVLAGLGCGFTIRKPDELRASVRALAQRLANAV